MTWHNYAIPTVLWIFGLVFSAPRIFRLLSAFFTTEEQEVESIEGIPTSELLDHLFTFGTFKRDDIEDKFKIPRYRYTALAKKLKELDVLTSGENNATVLNPDCSREHVASILEGKTTAAELEKPLTIVRPLPSFTRRQIRDSLQETDAKQACNPCAAVCAA
ncbi:hypothetical protein [Blastopirellula marina]|uniref:hypothetical protein n=1 Tax=Blastopirellula marina TaxID=124 RepID=UPI0011B08A0D|nr:hypothetical protein [Blastopirellula marina]